MKLIDPQTMTPSQRLRQAVSLIAQAALSNVHAICFAGDCNALDIGLGVARGILEGCIAMVPVAEIDSLERELQKCYRAAVAGEKAIREELGRRIELASVVPLNGKGGGA